MGEQRNPNGLRGARTAAGLSQAALARAAGVTRQAINAIELGQYLPNTAVAIRIARRVGRSVEYLFGDPHATTTSVAVAHAARVRSGDRVLLGRVGDRIVSHARAGGQSMIEGFSTADGIVREGRVELFAAEEDIEHTLFLAGCDPSLALLAAWVSDRVPAGRLAWIPASSEDALSTITDGTAHVAGIHLRDAPTLECNVAPAERALGGSGGTLVAYTTWEQGFVVQPGNPKAITHAESLTQPGVRIVNRERGAGSRALLDGLLVQARIPTDRVQGYGTVARSHMSVARAVAAGVADAGIGLRAVAEAHGLGFVPLAPVNFDLVIPSEYRGHPVVDVMLAVLHESRTRRALAALPGYDSGQAGAVRHTFPRVA